MAGGKEDRSGDVWVLDTETKGTGANMVPLDRVLRHGVERVPGFSLSARRESPVEQPQPKVAHRFRILDVMTRQVLAGDVDARHVVETLATVRSIVDVSIYTWDATAGTWRRLSFGVAKRLWDLRDRVVSDS